MLSLAFAVLLSVAVGHPVAPNSASKSSHTHIDNHAAGALAPSGYTHEVELARQRFQKAFDEAAALVVAAPDGTDPQITVSTSVQSSVPTTSYTGGVSTVTLEAGDKIKDDLPRNSLQKVAEDTSSHKSPSPEVQVHTVSISRAHVPSFVSSTQPDLTNSDVYAPVEVATDFARELEAARKELLTTYEEVASRAPESQQTPNQKSDSQLPAPDSTDSAGNQYTVTITSEPITPSGFTPEVEKARKEFMKAYDAAVTLATKTPDYSAVTHTSSTKAPAQVASPQPTTEVAKATAEFMAAWNAAAARVATIEAKLVKSSSVTQATITVPKQTQTVQEIKKAAEEFVAASNAAAQRTPIVQQATVSYGASKSSQSTEEIQRMTAEFMASWQAAARRASKIEQAVLKATSHPTGVPQHVEAMAGTQKATAEFMAAWNAAAARVPEIETAMYSVAQPAFVGGTREFLNLFKSAEQKAVQHEVSPGPVTVAVDNSFAESIGSVIAYAGTTASSPETVVTLKSFPLSHRLFAPIQGLPVYHNCKCQ